MRVYKTVFNLRYMRKKWHIPITSLRVYFHDLVKHRTEYFGLNKVIRNVSIKFQSQNSTFVDIHIRISLLRCV